MKLKAWDNHEKRWAKTHEIEGELFINPEVGDTGVFYIHDHSASGKLHYTFIHPTGLHDRHGKEIWEGDKLVQEGRTEVWVVQWNKPFGCFGLVYTGCKLQAIPFYESYLQMMEVIGNIFEGGE